MMHDKDKMKLTEKTYNPSLIPLNRQLKGIVFSDSY